MGDEQIAEPARRRAAAYDRQPSVWPAPRPTPPKPDRARRLGRMIRTGVTAGFLLAGPPWLLWLVAGNPITVLSSWWATGPFTADPAVTQADGLRVALIWACWCGWAVLATLLTGSVVGVLRGRRLPRWRLPMPLHRLVFGLTGTATAALVVTTPVTAAVASPPAHAAPAPELAQSASNVQHEHAIAPASADAGPAEPGHAQTGSEMATVAVEDARYEYRVHRGDTLSKVARVWLGDPDRWPDICQLNKHRHFSGGRILTDCDLIYPGWELRLPADAVAPPTAKPTRPPRTPARPAEPRERPQPDHGNPPVTSHAAASEAPAARPDSPAQETPSAAPGDEAESGNQRTGNDLVLPTGSIIPWTLAAAITAIAALVWLQRRRRYLPGTSDELQYLPAPVLAAQHHTRHITPPAPAEPARTQWLPSGGVGLIGSGADAAARGIIITALTTGTPTDPDQRAEVIIDQHTLTALVGDAPIAGWPRLRISDTLDQALSLLDTHLLHRARILDEHNLTALDTLRDTAPSEESLPPLLLITDSEQATGRNRARITFGLTHDLDVTTVVVGHWPHGPTISVTDDGHAHPEPGRPDSGTTRLAVLDVTTTRDLLATIREAHTGEPSPATAAHTPATSTSTAADTAATTSLAPAAPATTRPGANTTADITTPATAAPVLPLLAPGGVGLVGDGAHAAARAALISSLASGGPREPDLRGEVVIDGTTLATLIGADAAALGPWPRLHVADDVDQALSILDSRLLHRTRVLDSLRKHATHEESPPPVLLICETPPDAARMRTRVSFGLGNSPDVSALLLGEWPHGPTISVTTDGHTSVADGPAVEAVGDRVAVLDTAEAVTILTTLREAHTGEPPNPVLRPPVELRPQAPASEDAPLPPAPSDPADDAGPSDHSLRAPLPAVGGQPRVKASLRVLGSPLVEDLILPGRDLRGRAAELGVFLACHPDGADTETVAEHLVPDLRRRQAKQLVHTNASNLRHVLGRAGGPITGGYVLKRGTSARYRLDPTTVRVDVWQLRDLLSRAQLASAPARTDLLREACGLYTAPLADGCDYEWIEPHREKARQWGTEAHLLLADDLLDSDPQAASDLLDKAIGLDRYNEELYRKAMHARHTLRDADGIRALLRALTKALADLDAEPAETTVALAAKLRTSLEQQ